MTAERSDPHLHLPPAVYFGGMDVSASMMGEYWELCNVDTFFSCILPCLLPAPMRLMKSLLCYRRRLTKSKELCWVPSRRLLQPRQRLRPSEHDSGQVPRRRTSALRLSRPRQELDPVHARRSLRQSGTRRSRVSRHPFVLQNVEGKLYPDLHRDLSCHGKGVHSGKLSNFKCCNCSYHHCSLFIIIFDVFIVILINVVVIIVVCVVVIIVSYVVVIISCSCR